MSTRPSWFYIWFLLLFMARSSDAQIAFEDVTHGRGIDNPGNSESVWVDYNNDGRLDLITDF